MRNTIGLTCGKCGATYRVVPSRAERSKYCSKPCAYASRKPYTDGWRSFRVHLANSQRLPDACWPWAGYLQSNGYGTANTPHGAVYAHRAVYEHLVGPIPQGKELDHLCRNPRCVNPAHLEPVTRRENQRRGVSPSGKNMAKTHCLRGHALEGHNLCIVHRTNGKTDRRCRICHALRARR